jgi:lipopolysaccharide export system protein LptA
MKNVNAFFYFKDDTVLEVFSEKGIYNNKTLDMNFLKNVKAIYEGSTLTSQKAEYSNSNNFLQISENVKVDDIRGNFTAEKLYFDISEQTLNIASSKKGKINANINIK